MKINRDLKSGDLIPGDGFALKRVNARRKNFYKHRGKEGTEGWVCESQS